MAGKTLTIKIESSDVGKTLRELRGLPTEVNTEIRVESLKIAYRLVPKIKAAASTPLQMFVAQSVKASRDRVPAITMGGAGLRGVLTPGAEFGGGTGYRRTFAPVYGRRPRGLYYRRMTKQFGEHTGTEGKFFFPTFRENQDQIVEEWMEAVDRVLTKFGRR